MYKLKDHVTDEMLKNVGFEFEDGVYWRGFVGLTVMIDLDTKDIDISNNEDDIQDLIEKGWVEEV